MTRYSVTRHIVAALLAIGLASSAPGQTQNDSKADKPAPAAKSSAAAKAPQPAKTSPASKTSKPAKSGEGPAKETIQTPFGPMSVGEASEQPPPARDFAADPFVSAEEKGDLVVFRRKTPFGSQVWKKKKSELTADEQALLAGGRPEPPKTQPAKAEAAAKDASKPLPPGPQ